MTPLPQLRPLARHRAYYDELRAICATEGDAILASVAQAGDKLTIAAACKIALTHRLKLAALFAFLEDEHICACGTYDALKRRGLKPMAALTEIWEEMQG